MDKLTDPRKNQFIALYTNPEGRPSMQQIAAEIGVSRRTLSRWLNEAEVQKEVIKIERLRAMSLLPKAITAVEELLESGGDSAKSNAAKLVYQSVGLLVKDSIDVTLKQEKTR